MRPVSCLRDKTGEAPPQAKQEADLQTLPSQSEFGMKKSSPAQLFFSFVEREITIIATAVNISSTPTTKASPNCAILDSFYICDVVNIESSCNQENSSERREQAFPERKIFHKESCGACDQSGFTQSNDGLRQFFYSSFPDPLLFSRNKYKSFGHEHQNENANLRKRLGDI